MASDQSALVLLHGIVMSGDAWRDVVPLLSNRHRVYTPTAAGHRGGPPLSRRVTTVADLVDAAERYLDERGLDRPHLAGHSLGGWMAIELARRGRAATVCALAPAGFWSPGDAAQANAHKEVRKFQTTARIAGPVRPLAAFAMKSGTVRRVGYRSAARHADRITAAHAIEVLDDVSGCTLNVDDILASDQQLSGMDPLPCPMTIAWSEKDTIVSMAACDRVARQRVPQADYTVLPDAGHVPMFDSPGLVARTILATAARA